MYNHLALETFNNEYSMKQEEGKSNYAVLFWLAWDLKDLSDFIKSARTLKVVTQALQEDTMLDEND